MLEGKAKMRAQRSISLDGSAESAHEVEVFPGVHQRRYFLRGSLATLAAVIALKAAPKNALGQTTGNPSGATGEMLGWDDFLKQAVPVAQQLFAEPTFSVDEYLYRIGSLATRLKELPDSKLGPYTSVDPRVWFGPSFRGSAPFFIIQWRMEPGALLPPHNHPKASVCTLGFEGEVRLRNFEIIGEAPAYDSKKTFQVRETRDEMMKRGRIGTLSPIRDNIHCFRVGKEGARGIDINTLHGEMSKFSFLNMADKPIDPEKRIFEATWNPELGQPPAKKT